MTSRKRSRIAHHLASPTSWYAALVLILAVLDFYMMSFSLFDPQT